MRGQGTIYARGDSLWCYLYSGGDRRVSVAKAAGKRPGETTWKDAVAVLKKLNDRKTVARETGSILTTPKSDRLTVAELLTEYQAHRLIQGVKRPEGFAKAYKAVAAWWGDRIASKLTTERLEADIQAQLAAGFARGTVRTRLNGLFAALTWASDRLPRLPKKPELSVPLTRKGIWTAEEVERFCAVAPPWLADLTRFLSCTGWRIGEALGLTWDRVDLRAGMLRLDDTKTDDPRQRPIEPALLVVLRRRRETLRLGCALVFHVDGLPISDDRFRARWRQTLTAAGLPKKYPHDFRRTAYHELLLSGANLLDAMDLVGHKSLSSARRYAQPSVDRMRRALEQRDAVPAALLHNQPGS
jgi:integrase